MSKMQSNKDVKELRFSVEDMIRFGHFIRNNYYVAGTPDLIPYLSKR